MVKNEEYLALLELLNTNENWRKELESRAIIIKEDGNFVLLKYNQIASDFNDPVVRACRGCILTHTNYHDWQLVCAPFTKFSYGEEPWEKPIRWSAAYVREKIDGSLMKCWYYDGRWHLSTNGTINAFRAECNDEGETFGDIFELAIHSTFNTWAQQLDPDYTYMFELVSPQTKVVIDYPEPDIWYLGRRNIHTLEEDNEDIGIKRPQLYDLRNLNDILRMISDMDNQEGVVICDNDFNRIKIKSPNYLIKHRLANNGVITTRKILSMIQNLTIDDYLAYVGDSNGKVNRVQTALNNLMHKYDAAWENICERIRADQSDYNDRKVFASYARQYKCADFLFKKYDGFIGGAAMYLSNESIKRLKLLVEEELNNVNIL